MRKYYKRKCNEKNYLISKHKNGDDVKYYVKYKSIFGFYRSLGGPYNNKGEAKEKITEEIDFNYDKLLNLWVF